MSSNRLLTKYQFHRFLRPDASSRFRRYLSTAAARDIPIVTKKTGKKIPRAERKFMVEEYVNQYRALNAGKLPGIGNIKKHVGGGHYTIRAIFQELYSKSKASAIETARKSSLAGKTAQDDRVCTVKDSANSKMLVGKVVIEKGDGDSLDNGVKTSIVSMDTSFQVAIKLLEEPEPDLVDKTPPDRTVKEDLKYFGKPDHFSEVPFNSRNTGLDEVNKSDGQASAYNEQTMKTTEHEASGNQHQEDSSWGIFKSIASFISFWRKT